MTNKTHLFIIVMMMIYSGLFAQTTLVLQPDAAAGKDALIGSNTATSNWGTHEEITSAYWTVQGNWVTVKSLLEFDLSQIPANAVITDAKLSLWSNSTTQSHYQLHSGDNASYLKRILQPWNENTVTWNNQPTTTSQNQVLLATSTSQTQDYLNINVTALFQDIVSSGNNYGIMLQLTSEYDYQSMVLASSDYSNAAKRPKLEITYIVAQSNCITLQPDAATGKDALIGSNTANSNWGTHEEITSAYWTVQSNWVTVKSLLEFDLSQIPANAVINDAKLSLWSNSTTQSHYQLHSGDNESYLKRVLQPWNENTVTWNNQPTTTSQNQVLLATSTSQTQDYLNLNVTALFQDIVSSNYGLMLELTNENSYQSMVLASSDYAVAAKRPKLEICYAVASGIRDIETESNNLMVFPNPANGLVTISFVQSVSALPKEVKVFNMLGEEAGSYVLAQGVSNLQINTSEFSKGAHIVKATYGEKSYTKRLIIH
jgi:flagellar basal body rod protein FlgB